MRWIKFTVLVFLAVSVLVWPVLAEKVVLNYNLSTEPPTADPALATDTTSVDIDEAMFLGLTDLGEKDMAPVPELATSWDVSADGLEWTFYMRNDVPWVHCDPDTGEITKVLDADGNPRIVNANEVVYGVKRTLNPITGSDYAYVLYIIKGGRDLNTVDPAAENFQELFDGVGVEALDDFTVKFTLRAPGGYFPQIASMWIARPVPEWVIDEYGDAWAEPGNIVTNGAFCMKEWVHEDHMVFVKNPFWFGWDLPDAGNIDEIRAVMVVEDSTAYAMYLNDELDNQAAPQPEMDAIRADPTLSQELLIMPRGCTYYYGFVTNKPPVDDPNVRRALSMTIDRVTLIDEITKGNQLPANTFAPGMIFGNAAHDTDIAPWALPDSLGGWGYEDALAEAQRLMADAGYPEGEGFEIVLMHNVSEGHARIAQAIQAMWSEAFPKAKFIVETMEWKVYLTALQKESPLADMPHVYRLGWCLDYPDENNWIHEVMNPEEGANRFRLSYDDPYVGDLIKEFSALTMQAGAEGDPDIRKALYKRAEKLASDEIALYAPIYYYTRVVMIKPWLNRTFDDTNHWAKWSIDVTARGS